MFGGARSRTRFVVALVIGCVGSLLFGAVSSATQVGSGASPRVPSPRVARVAGASFVGPVVSHAESSTISWGRDGGITVPLPNGTDFWLWGDTPRYTYKGGKWSLTAFIYGTSAGLVKYSAGSPPAGPVYEVRVGHKLAAGNQPAQFLPSPKVYMPDGSGRICNKANGGPSAGAVRWASGAALLPDKTNILIPYLVTCVISLTRFYVEGWGFAEYDWKHNNFSVPPTDVFPPARSGAAIPRSRFFGSPVISGSKVVFFSETCCDSSSKVYATTMAANRRTLRNRASFLPKPISGLRSSYSLSVVPPSRTQPHFTMYEPINTNGQYRLLKSSSPTGPWVPMASGTLPRCGNAPYPCNSVELHPEMSTSSKVIVTYFLPGYGPGIAKHPYPHLPLSHVVMVYLPA